MPVNGDIRKLFGSNIFRKTQSTDESSNAPAVQLERKPERETIVIEDDDNITLSTAPYHNHFEHAVRRPSADKGMRKPGSRQGSTSKHSRQSSREVSGEQKQEHGAKTSNSAQRRRSSTSQEQKPGAPTMSLDSNSTTPARTLSSGESKRATATDKPAVVRRTPVAPHRSMGLISPRSIPSKSPTESAQRLATVTVEIPRASDRSRTVSAKKPSQQETRSPERKRIKLEAPAAASPKSARLTLPNLDDLDSTDEDEPALKTAAKTQTSTINPAALSFLSTSSLSQAPSHLSQPPSSQLSTHSASRRTTQDGKPTVTASSPSASPVSSRGSPSGDSDVDEIERLISLKAADIALKPRSPTLDDLPRAARRQRPVKPTIKLEEQSYKHSLSAIRKRNAKEAAWQTKLAKLEEESKLAEARLATAEERALDEEVARVDGDGRLKLAMDRMDVLEEEVRWDFFASEVDESAESGKLLREFWPTVDEVREHKLSDVFQVPLAEDVDLDMVLFAADLYVREPLRIKAWRWCLSMLLKHPAEDVAMAYGRVLCAVVQHPSAASFMSMNTLRAATLQLGAKPELVFSRPTGQASQKSKPAPVAQAPEHNVLAFLQLLEQLVEQDRLALDAIEEGVRLVCLLMVDTTLTQQTRLAFQAQKTALALITATLDDWYAQTSVAILKHLTSPILQDRLLTLLRSPVREVSEFNRIFALTALLPKPEPHICDLQDPATWTRIHALVASPLFTEESDALILSARTGLLSTALGAGFHPHPFWPAPAPEPETSATATDTESSRTSLFFAKRKKPLERSAEQKAYEKEMEALVKGLERVAGNMRAVGAAHVRRMQARSRVEGLAGRVRALARAR